VAQKHGPSLSATSVGGAITVLFRDRRHLLIAFPRIFRSAGTDALLSPRLLSKLLFRSDEEFLVFSLALRTSLLTVNFSPDETSTTWTGIRQYSRTLFGIVQVVVLGPSIFF
jgi:hypothetical protein